MNRPAPPSTPSTHPDAELALLVAALGLVAGLLTAVAAAAQEPDPPSHHEERARRLLAEGSPSRAVYHLRRHLEAQPADVEVRSLLADTYARLGLRAGSLEQLHLVLARRPDEPGALETLARMQYRDGKPDEALKTLARLRETGFTGTDLDALEGRVLFRLGRNEEAREPLALALAQRPDDAGLLKVQGLNALRIGGRKELDLALSSLQRALELRPDDASLHNNLGFVHERRGELERAFLRYVEAEGLSDGNERYAGNRRRLEAVVAKR